MVAGLVGIVAGFTGCSDPADKVAKANVSATNQVAAAPAAPAPASAQKLALSADSKIEFTGSKVTGSHNGGFKKFDGAVEVAGGKIVGTPSFKIDMTSTFVDNPRLEGHLKSPDFFDVAKFPTSTFTVTKIEGEGASTKVSGTLELHGVTKAIEFPATVEVSADGVHVKAEFAINRKDFKILYPGKPDDLIRDNVVIRLDLKAAQSKA